jgi:hypothetical protein
MEAAMESAQPFRFATSLNLTRHQPTRTTPPGLQCVREAPALRSSSTPITF